MELVSNSERQSREIRIILKTTSAPSLVPLGQKGVGIPEWAAGKIEILTLSREDGNKNSFIGEKIFDNREKTGYL
jgi:hypothetical protein